jgi:phosphoribosyl-dephospho-CoA transferase
VSATTLFVETVFAQTVAAETVFPLARPDAPRRHGWAWLAGDWPRHLRDPLARDDEARVHAWSEAGHPFVVAGRGCADGDDDVRLGLSLPDKTRVGLHLSRSALMRFRAPLSLEEAEASAPPSWRDSLRIVQELARPAGLAIRVYGSLAWLHWSGLPFLRPGSDIDLLLEIGPDSRPAAVYDALRSLTGWRTGPRLDGEVVSSAGLAVAWRELAGQPPEVLVKGAGAPLLLDRRDWDRMITEGAA